MTTQGNPIPKGYNTLTPYINVKNAEAAIKFYENAFGAKETGRIIMPDGSIGHAEIQIGDSIIMLSEENTAWGNLSPFSLGGSPVCLCIYVKDVDAVFNRAISEGATVTGEMQVKDQFYGDRTGSLTDPFGHKWSIMTHIEDVSFKEMQKRSDAMFMNMK
jgi:PhnB protein